MGSNAQTDLLGRQFSAELYLLCIQGTGAGGRIDRLLARSAMVFNALKNFYVGAKIIGMVYSNITSINRYSRHNCRVLYPRRQ